MTAWAAHGALQAEKQAVVEQARVIDAVGVADQGIGETAEIEETIPVGIVAGEPGDLETASRRTAGPPNVRLPPWRRKG